MNGRMAECPTPGKLPYENRGAARQAAKDAERRFTLRGQMRPYSCVCGNWHLTRMAAADFRRLTRRKRKAA
jgi:hypothetical protein